MTDSEEDILPPSEEPLPEDALPEIAPEAYQEQPAGENPTPKMLSNRDIPLTLSVEVARVNMPLGKILQLKPGNLLDLKVSPELTVTLTLNGQSVAIGELVKIGESIGVKILAIHG